MDKRGFFRFEAINWENAKHKRVDTWGKFDHKSVTVPVFSIFLKRDMILKCSLKIYVGNNGFKIFSARFVYYSLPAV